MHQIYGSIEICLASDWYEVVNVGTLLLKHADLYACLFGVDNYAGFVPLFADRGLPADCSETLRSVAKPFLGDDSHETWATWPELMRIDWQETAARRDQRVTEFVRDDGQDVPITKWLNKPGLDWVRDALELDPDSTIQVQDRTFARPVLRRADSLRDTDFPLVMKLMACLAERFGDEGVRLTVWFGL